MSINHHLTPEGVPLFKTDTSSGRLFGVPVEEFLESFSEDIEGKFKNVVLDFSGKESLNSSGLGDLLKIHSRCIEQGIQVILAGVSERVASLLDMTGTEKFFIMKEDD